MARTKAHDRLRAKLAGDVLTARRGGARWATIVNELGIRGGVDEAVRLFEEGLAAATHRYSTGLELDRLEAMHRGLWQRAQQGDVDAVDRVLKLAERREKLDAPVRENDHALEQAFDRAAESSTTLLAKDLDAALVEGGRKIAARIDAATATADGQELTRALYLWPHMMNTLREMHATPESRRAAGIQISKTRSGRGRALDRMRKTQGGAGNVVEGSFGDTGTGE
jgi:hypothetical protein